MKRPIILVTRPEPQATRFVEKLEQLGMGAIKSPVLEISEISSALDKLSEIHAPDVLVITSQNALRYLNADFIAANAHIPLLTSGETTAAEAKARGFRNVSASRAKGASGIVDILKVNHTRHESNSNTLELVFLTGRPRTPTLERELPQFGKLSIVELYESHAAEALNEAAFDALVERKIDAVTLFSTQSATSFLSLLKMALWPNFPGSLKELPIFVISNRIADEMFQGGFENVHVSATENQDSLAKKLVEQLKIHR